MSQPRIYRSWVHDQRGTATILIVARSTKAAQAKLTSREDWNMSHRISWARGPHSAELATKLALGTVIISKTRRP